MTKAYRLKLPKSNEFNIPVPMTKSWYRAYLDNPYWTRHRRPQALEDANYQCEYPGCTDSGWGPLHVHHLNYDHLYCETRADLMVLCPYHHAQMHAPVGKPANDNKQISFCFDGEVEFKKADNDP